MVDHSRIIVDIVSIEIITSKDNKFQPSPVMAGNCLHLRLEAISFLANVMQMLFGIDGVGLRPLSVGN